MFPKGGRVQYGCGQFVITPALYKELLGSLISPPSFDEHFSLARLLRSPPWIPPLKSTMMARRAKGALTRSLFLDNPGNRSRGTSTRSLSKDYLTNVGSLDVRQMKQRCVLIFASRVVNYQLTLA